MSATPIGYARQVKVYRSAVIKGTLEPKWEPFILGVEDVGGLDSEITFDCYDWEADGSNPLIGSLTTTLREFMFGPVQLPLVHPNKKGGYESSVFSCYLSSQCSIGSTIRALALFQWIDLFLLQGHREKHLLLLPTM